MTTTPTTLTTRDRLAVALDVDTLDEAEALAKAVAPHFGIAKVGLQMFAGNGIEAVERIKSTGLDVFLDLKLHDIPNTVGSAARQLGHLGVRYTTIHAAGGVPMIQAAVEGLAVGADAAGHAPPMVLAVTVLTSMPDAPAETLTERAVWAQQGGAGGVVCAVPDLPTIIQAAPDLIPVCPGIRLPKGDTHDQQRIATPSGAIENGAGILVVGRAVTKATDPTATAAAIAQQVDSVS